MANYFQGSLVRVTATFENAAHVVADPTVITARIENPNGAVTSYVYQSTADIVRSSIGVYYLDVDASLAGTWYYRFEGTGAVKAASQDKFTCIAERP